MWEINIQEVSHKNRAVLWLKTCMVSGIILEAQEY